MRFVCENCLAQYMIKDEKVRPQGVKVRCKKCSHIMTVKPPEADLALSEEATIRMPLPDDDDAEGFFEDSLGPSEIPSPSLRIFEEEGPTAAHLVSSAAGALPKNFEEEGLLPPVPPADLGSLFDDPELKSPSSGFFGSLDDEELGDAFERAISQRETPSLQLSSTPAPSAASLEPSIVVSQGLSQAANVEWFVAIEDNQVGPLDFAGMKSHWQQGNIGRDSLCWKSGMRDWLPIGAVEGLFEQLNVASVSAPSTEQHLALSESAAAAPIDWQPSAASALASLVQDELQGMTASPVPPPMGPMTSSSEAIPLGAVSVAISEMPAISSLPSAPVHGSMTPAPTYASSLSMPPVPSVSATSSFYLPPAPPPAQNNKAMWAMAAGLLAVAVAVVVMLVVFMRSPENVAPPVLVQAPPQVATPPPLPPVVEMPPVVERPPAVQEQGDASESLAQQLLPPKPVAKPPERKAPRSDAVASTPRSAPSASPPGSSRAQDDFTRLFGDASEPTAPKRPERQTTVYVPPAPGSGGVKQSLEDADIMEYILSRKAEVASCAREQKAKDSNVKGAMVVEWNIATSGKTSQVRLAATASNFQGTHFADCVMKLIQNWQFPAHRTAGGTRKFNFRI